MDRKCENCGDLITNPKRKKHCSDQCMREYKHRLRNQRERIPGHPDRIKKLARVKAQKVHRTPQPCELCGGPGQERHHRDYGQPLTISWLCECCHENITRGREA